jgi:hypothetical protein
MTELTLSKAQAVVWCVVVRAGEIPGADDRCRSGRKG